MYARKNAIKLRQLEQEVGLFSYPTATPISHGQLNYIAVETDAQDNWLYYSDVRKDVIYRARPDGTGEAENL